MKKMMSLIMATTMMATLLAGCGSQTPAGNASTSGNASTAGSASGGQKITMKMHLSCGTTDYVYEAGEKFADLVSEKTGGNVTVQLYPSSSLGTTADCIEGLSIGACDIVFDSVGNLASLTELANIDAVPYMYSGYDHYRAVWEGGVGDTIRKAIGDGCGKVLLGYGLQGVRVMTTTKPVRSVADVKGMKLRVPTIPIYLDTWTWLGATPTPMAATDIFTAIQQGTVEGQENPYSASASLSMQECCKYVTETNHVYSGDSFIMDPTYFNNLPAEYQTALEEAAKDATSYLTDLAIKVAKDKKQIFVDAGCEIIETDTSEWKTAMNGFLEAKYPNLVQYAKMIADADPQA